MSTEFFIMLIIGSIAMLCSFIAMVFILFIKRNRLKEIDIAVHGYEFTHDSFFYYGLRILNYSGGFLWDFGKKRSGLTGKIEHFDMKFKWPFIVHFILMVISGICIIITGIIQYRLGI